MLDLDREEFEKAVSQLGFTIRRDVAFSSICTPEGDIRYQISELTDVGLTSGRIAVLTDNPGLSTNYKKLRKWITGRYDNDVYGENISIPQGPTNPARYPFMYVGPAAASACLSGRLILRHFKGSPAQFAIGKPPQRG